MKVKNISKYPIQIKLWMTDSQLKGQILSTNFTTEKYHLLEKNHNFVKTSNGVYRYNEIWRETLIDGLVTKAEKVVTNCALVMYERKEVDMVIKD